jgi:hypothetical protein
MAASVALPVVALPVIVFNMQGANHSKWTTLRNQLTEPGRERKASSKIALVQETGKPPVAEADDRGGLKIYNWGSWCIYTLEFGKNLRCTTGVVVPEHLRKEIKAYTALKPSNFDPNDDRRRKLLCLQIGDADTNVWYCSIHAPASVNAVPYSVEMLKQCRSRFAKFVCGGDFNCSKQELVAGLEADNITDLTVTEPEEATHTSGKIDYVVSRGIVYAPKVQGSSESDHGWAEFAPP